MKEESVNDDIKNLFSRNLINTLPEEYLFDFDFSKKIFLILLLITTIKNKKRNVTPPPVQRDISFFNFLIKNQNNKLLLRFNLENMEKILDRFFNNNFEVNYFIYFLDVETFLKLAHLDPTGFISEGLVDINKQDLFTFTNNLYQNSIANQNINNNRCNIGEAAIKFIEGFI
jgi:hypothetical protein